MKTEAGTRVLPPQAKERPPGATRSKKRKEAFSPRTFRGSPALLTP